MKTIRFAVPAACTLALCLGGCSHNSLLGPSMDLKVPSVAQRPAELDRLNVFVGAWNGIAEQRDLKTGEVTRIESVTTTRWAADNRFLVHEGTRSRNGAPESFLNVATWDPALRLYRQWSFDSSGAVVAGEDWTFDTGNTWRLKRQFDDSRIEGILRISPDGSRMDMTYSVYGRGSSGKVAEGSAHAIKTSP